jgi:hypothetical protein
VDEGKLIAELAEILETEQSELNRPIYWVSATPWALILKKVAGIEKSMRIGAAYSDIIGS